ncbi:MAG: phosphoribosylamine--glycine ligase, partial [Nanoarchaeota archaeon]
MKKVLIIGSGGREHALGWKLGQSDEISEILYAPGNAGTEEEKGRNISIDGSKKDNFLALVNLVEAENVDMVVVGPETPLADGIVDYFNYRGYNMIFGPTQRASLLESDKFFSFDLMNELHIPQANSVKCYSIKEAINAINERSTQNGIVIKARGLTGGKGVTVYDSKDQALVKITNHARKYGSDVLIAERLYGQEFSIFGISDGNKVSPLEISLQDHKPLLDNDKGSNTGGMGAYGPVPIASVEVVKYVAEKIMTPLVQRMKEQGSEYKGFLYSGMIMTKEGPKVIECNIRFGDPECQSAMMMLKNDLYKALLLSLEGRLDQVRMEFNPGASC